MSVYKPSTKYLVTNHFAVLLVLLIIFVAVGYFLLLGKPEETAANLAALEELAEARIRWSENAPDMYRYVVDRHCECPPETGAAYIVTVSPTERMAAFPIPVEAASGAILDAPDDPVWIEDLFALIERALQSGSIVDPSYHYLYGYPQVAVFGAGGEESIRTEEYEVRDFEVIRSP
jgi:hypothetical protein